jgi:hypothetical protein
MLGGMSRAAAPLAISDGQREVLEALAGSRGGDVPCGATRTGIAVGRRWCVDTEIDEVVGVPRPTVLAWRGQFEKDGLVGFGEVAQGRRRPSHARPPGSRECRQGPAAAIPCPATTVASSRSRCRWTRSRRCAGLPGNWDERIGEGHPAARNLFASSAAIAASSRARSASSATTSASVSSR